MLGSGKRTALRRPQLMPTYGRSLSERQAENNSHQYQQWKAFHARLGFMSAQHLEIEADLCPAKHLGLPKEEQARQDALPGDTARRLKHACHTVLDHVDRSGRHQHVRISKITKNSSFQNTKNF